MSQHSRKHKSGTKSEPTRLSLNLPMEGDQRSTGGFAKLILCPVAVLLFSVGMLSCGCHSSAARPVKSAATAATATAVPPAPVHRVPSPTLEQAAATPSAPFVGDGWQPMFDNKTLTGWRPTDFAGHGEIECFSGLILCNAGDPFTGLNWTNEFPKLNYEVALDAMRVMGSDFFCGLTVPVQDGFCSLIVGGWGGTLVGISSLDGMDASENETTKFVDFQTGRWYRIRLRVTEGRIEAWVDKDKLVDVVTTGRRLSVRPGDIEMSKPFGLSCWQCTAAYREIRMRPVTAAADPPRKY